MQAANMEYPPKAQVVAIPPIAQAVAMPPTDAAVPVHAASAPVAGVKARKTNMCLHIMMMVGFSR